MRECLTIIFSDCIERAAENNRFTAAAKMLID
jgi:hypothetical protein